MIIVTGSVQAQPEHVDELLALCVEHVTRSRGEPGCISHEVHRDVEDPLRVFFFERWKDTAALRAHFEVPASLTFVTAAGVLASASPTLEIYAAEATSL
jgi:quinol monooxygenase YgiN